MAIANFVVLSSLLDIHYSFCLRPKPFELQGFKKALFSSRQGSRGDFSSPRDLAQPSQGGPCGISSFILRGPLAARTPSPWVAFWPLAIGCSLIVLSI
jgi:hypothetical protein